jgi:predicted nicotinamide N-methyase
VSSRTVTAPVIATTAPVRGGLPAALAARYDLTDHAVSLPSGDLRVFGVRDTNALVDALDPASFALDERLPYWADLWASSVALARWCESPAGVRPGEEVLELGCGLGLAGIAAARAGGRVTLTDYEEDALLFARANLERNLPSGLPVPRVLHFDWRSTSVPARASLILAADVAYERRMLLPLLETITRCLLPGGRAAVAEPGRSIGGTFFAIAEEQGYAVQRSPAVVSWRGRQQEVILALLTPPEGFRGRG